MKLLRKVKYQQNLSEYDIEILRYVFTTEYERKIFNVNYLPNSTKIVTLSKGKYNLLEKRIGKWVVIDKISDSKLIVEYKEGEIDGSSKLYNKKGILILDENYKLGKNMEFQNHTMILGSYLRYLNLIKEVLLVNGLNIIKMGKFFHIHYLKMENPMALGNIIMKMAKLKQKNFMKMVNV